jgi:antitoxin ParD1/3/4
MNISLPDQMKYWVEAQTAEGKYANTSDYVRDLIRKDRLRTEGIAKLQAEIDKGRAGPFREITDLDAYFDEIKQRTRTGLKSTDAA